MMMNKLGILLIVFCFMKGVLWAQGDSLILRVSVKDKSTQEGIPNVNITLNQSEKGKFIRTNPQGICIAKIPNSGSVELKLNHPLYESAQATKKVSNTDTLDIRVEMIPIKSQQLKEIVVKAPGVPDTVFMSNRLSVADFEIQKDGRLILLAYPKRLNKSSELLLYNGIEIENSFTVPGTAQELVRDYRGNAHVVCTDNVFGIYVGKSKIGISTIEKAYFLKYLAPILDTNISKMYFSNYSKDYPAFTYFTFDNLDSTYSKIINIQDDLMMELYRSEYKWVDVRTKLWAKNKEYETGIDAEVWVGANYFTQSIYYEELYAPFFNRNDTLFVFDHYKDLLFSFDKYGEPLDSVPIYYHYNPRSSGWKKQMIQDRITGEIYAVFDKAGYTQLGRINVATGEIEEKVQLEFRYVDKVAVSNNFAYYIYRPFESIQKKFLYKEKLLMDYQPSKVPYGTEISTDTGR
jgi:hypothetical protein